MVSIYYTQKSEIMSPQFWEWCKKQLPQNIHDRLKKKQNIAKIQMSILGYILLKEALKHNGFSQQIEEIYYTINGRPSTQENFDFNISHSGDYVVCVFSTQLQVGIDIERMKPISLELLSNHFNPDEWKEIQYSQNSEQSFYKLWTKKEAMVKADGRGLTIPLKEIIIKKNHGHIERSKWFIQEIPIHKNYMIHLVTNEQIQEYNHVQISFIKHLVQ